MKRIQVVVPNTMKELCILFVALWVSCVAVAGQVVTGFPPYGSFGGGSFDRVNNSNLNVHFGIPIFSRGGRGISFNYVLSYDSSVWSPRSLTGASTWTPVPQWGWRGISEATTGYTSYKSSLPRCWHCDENGVCGWVYYTVYSNWAYHDTMGTPHPFTAITTPGSTTCGVDPVSSFTGATNDGSGYTVAITNYTNSTVYSRSGWTIDPAGSPLGSGSVLDTNGNQIAASVLGSTTTFNDTLGSGALTVTSIDDTEKDYTYTGPSEAAGTFKMILSPYTVHTNFNCIGVTEYTSPGQIYLVSEIDLPDIGANSNNKYTFTYEVTPGDNHNPHYVTGRLASVTLPTGGTISYTYSGGSNGITCVDGSAAGLNRTTPDSATAWQYTRSGGPPASTTITDPLSQTTVIDFQGLYETQRVIKDSGGATKLTVDTCYNGASIPCTGTAITPPISSLTVQKTIPGVSPAKTITTFNSYGLPTKVDEYDWGPTFVRETMACYASLTNQNIKDRVSDAVVYSQTGNPSNCTGTAGLAAKTTYGYHATNGNLQSETRQTGGTPTTISRSFGYGQYGVLTSASDFDGHSTTYTNFTCANSTAFPQTVTSGGLQTSLGWNCVGGALSSVTDPNTQRVDYKYDTTSNFWRLAETDYPDGGIIKYSHGDPPNNTTLHTELLVSGSTYHDAASILDGLGRATHTTDDSSGATVDTGYNAVGLVASVSNPHSTSAHDTDGTTQFLYDALGRLANVGLAQAVEHQDGSHTSVDYSGNCVTTTDPELKARKTCTDGLGRISSVAEDPSGLNYQTTYSYDVLGNLTGVAQGTQKPCAGGTLSRSFTYDKLSRLTSACTPESGTTYFYYTTSGGQACSGNPTAVCRRTDARSITTTYSYSNDALNRLTGKSYSNGDPSVTYYYDQTSYNGLTINNRKGRRTGMSDGSGQTAWSFDPVGRPVIERRTVTGITKQGSYSYNKDGSLSSITYGGSGRTINYSVNSAGQPTKAQQDSGQGGYLYAQNATYWPHGALATMLNGESGSFGGITATYDYNNRLWLSSVFATSQTGTAIDLDYDYFPNGNVHVETNNRDNDRNLTYEYDPLNRVKSAVTTATSGSDCWGQTIPTDGTGYDRYGNLKKINSSRCSPPTLDVSVDQATNRLATSSGFSYDLAGNMLGTGTGGNTYTWDAEGRLATVSNGTSGTTKYIYDGDGKRVAKCAPGTPPAVCDITHPGTLYWHDLGGNVLTDTNLSGSLLEDYIYFAGQRVAMAYNSSAYFYYGGATPGTRVVTNSIGGDCYDADYYLFGLEKVVTNTCPQNSYKFAEMQNDGESGDYHTWFRQYRPNVGRWLSPDPLAGSVLNPQSLNRYAYVLNNPCSLIDPLGLQCRVVVAIARGGLTDSQLDAAEAEFMRVLGNAGISVTIATGGHSPDYFLSFQLSGAVGGSAPFGITLRSALEGSSFAPEGFVYVDTTAFKMAPVGVGAADARFGTALGNTAAHEFGHYAGDLLNTNSGVMGPFDPLDFKLRRHLDFTASEVPRVQNICSHLKNNPRSGVGGSPGGGPPYMYMAAGIEGYGSFSFVGEPGSSVTSRILGFEEIAPGSDGSASSRILGFEPIE